MADARLSIGVSADAKQASATFKDLAADIKNVGKESVGVTDGVARVAAALDKLKSAPDTPIALARATAKAKVEIADLRAELEKTPASAEKMKAITAALAQADQAIEGTIKRAGKLAESQEEVKQKMGLTAKGAEALGGSLGSLTGVMGKMADSSSAVAQGVAKVGFAVVAAGQAFKLGYETGEKFRQGLQAIGVQVPDLSDKMAKLVVNIEGMVRGYKEAELVESAAMNRARQIIALRESQAAAERALATAQAAAGVEWKNADAERQKTIDKLNAIEQILARTTKSEEAYNAAIRENAKTLTDVAQAAEAQGIAIEKIAPRTAAAASAAADLAASQKAVASATKEATVSLQEEINALDAQIAASTRLKMQDEAAGVARREHTNAVEQAERANQDFGTSLDYVAQKVVENGGTLTAGAPIWLTVARATDEATAALMRYAEASRALREEQVAALDATKGWTDYLIALQDGYESGVTSLYNYTTELQRFKTQLLQLFGAAQGEAKESLQAMIDLIQKLIATAGAGGSNKYDPSMAGQLEKAVRDFKKGA